MVAVYEDELLVEDTELTDEEEPLNTRYEISSFPTDFTVRVMYEKWRADQLVIPDFQRRYVWTLPQASRLIESFLLGLPIPQVFLYRERTSPRLLVVDGHQRLATIAKFYSGQFSRDRVFRLRGVNSAWEGKTYDDLSDDDRLMLDDSTLRSIVIQQIQPDDNSSVYQIFDRLNTGGTQLNAMEIRKAISSKDSYDLLDRLNNNTNWRDLLGMPEPERRLRDIELVLRVLALADNWHMYVKPMKKFINDYMETLGKAKGGHNDDLEVRFEHACQLVRSQLGAKPFNLRGRLNVAALDSVMACAVELTNSLTPDLQAAYKKLRADEKFQGAVTYDTSDASVVRQRFELVHSFFRA